MSLIKATSLVAVIQKGVLLSVHDKFFLRTLVSWGPFLETPDNFSGPKTILGAQYSPIAIQFLLILKAKFESL